MAAATSLTGLMVNGHQFVQDDEACKGHRVLLPNHRRGEEDAGIGIRWRVTGEMWAASDGNC